MGLFSSLMREVATMRCLWRRPYRIEATAFTRVLPDFLTDGTD